MRQNLRKLEIGSSLVTFTSAATRRDAQKQAFLMALEAAGKARDAPSIAARAAGVNRSTPYRWKVRDPTFAAAWREIATRQFQNLLAEVEADLRARDEARQARKAELRPIYQANAAKARAAKRRW